MMAGGLPNVARGRKERDWYPTPDEVTRALTKELPIAGINVWEPCVGDGAMARVLTEAGANVYGSDIHPLCDADTLDFFEATEMPFDFEVLITNPPFKDAERFIRHAWLRLQPLSMAMVLKSTYWHSLRRQKLWAECQPAAIYPLTWRPDFERLGRPTMEMMWCYWQRGWSGDTIYKPLSK